MSSFPAVVASQSVVPNGAPTDSLSPISAANLNDLIGARLRDYILRSGLQAGDRLPSESVLAGQLGVSRTAVREALRSLEALGMVEARQGYGRVVCEFSFRALLQTLSYGLPFQNSNVLQANEIRKALDSYFMEAAVKNLTEEDMSALAGLVERMQSHSAAGEPILAEDHAFHRLLYERTGNPLAIELFEITWGILLNAADQRNVYREEPPGTAGDHAALFAAIQARDVARARDLVVNSHWNVAATLRGAARGRRISGSRHRY